MGNLINSFQEMAEYVQKYPETVSELLELQNSWDLEKVKAFFSDWNLSKPYDKEPTHPEYIRHKATIDEILKAPSAYALNPTELDQIHMDDVAGTKVYSEKAGEYDNVINTFFPLPRKVVVDTVDLQPNEKLLEVGCGPGSNFEFLPTHGEIVGIDIAPGCIDLAGKKIKELSRANITVQVMDICEATLPDDSFDKVFTLTAMIACRNPLKALQQMRRVLKPNGMLITFEAPKSEIKEVAALQYLLHPVTTVGGMCWIPSYPFGLLPYNAHYDLTAMLPVAGFEIVENLATFDPYAILHLTKSKAVK